MSLARPTTAEELKQYIRVKLGSPIYKVEITDDQFDIIIADIFNFAREYVYDMLQSGLYILNTSQGQGNYTLSSDVYAVTDILDRSVYDQFFLRFPTRDRSPEEISFVMSVTSQARGNAMSDMMFGLQNLNFFRDQFLPRNMWQWNRNTHILHFVSTPASDTSTTSISSAYALLVEREVDISSTCDIYHHFWILKYALALSKVQMGMNLTKYTAGNLPGGLSINGDKFVTEGQAEKDALEKQAIEELGDVSKLSSVYWG